MRPNNRGTTKKKGQRRHGVTMRDYQRTTGDASSETTRERLVMHPPGTFEEHSGLAATRLARQVHEAAVLFPLPRKNIGVLHSQEISNLGEERRKRQTRKQHHSMSDSCASETQTTGCACTNHNDKHKLSKPQEDSSEDKVLQTWKPEQITDRSKKCTPS